LDIDELEMLEEARLQMESSNKQDKLSNDQIICECNCISLEAIREFSKEKEVNLLLLSEKFGLGSGCSSCVKNFELWKDKV
jgi:NAD(P)H-nitrite reductase large subunit